MAIFFKKVPNIKMPKNRMEGLGQLDAIEELDVEYTPEMIAELKKNQVQQGFYPGTDYKTVKEFFKRSTELYADRTFILEKFNRKAPFEEVTYKRFYKDVNDLGTGLTRAFKLKGETVIILGETTYEWYVSYTALLCGAGIAVPTDKELPDNELENIIKRSEASAVIFSPKKKGQVEKIANKCPGVKYFMEMYSDAEIEGRFVGLDFVMNEGEVIADCGDTSFMDIEIDPDALAVLVFTSGTTSQSKGVMLCNRNLAANVNGITPYIKAYPEDRFFSVLPLHHTYESTIGFLVPMAIGCSVAVCRGLRHIVDDMKETQPTCLLAVPLLIETLYKKINTTIEKSGKASLVNSMIRMTNAMKRTVGVDIKRKVFKDIHANLGGNLRIVVSAAAPIDPKVGKWLEDIGIWFLQGYGLTETAPISAVSPDFDRRLGSAGRVVLCNKAMIQDPNEKGEGEILIKGDTVMLGYYEAPELTAEAIVDGWFHSGDIGFMDEDDFVYITGRIKNVIVTQNGKNIYPEEIEGLLSRVPEIAECMVYGKEVSGEKELIITAKVIPDYDQIAALHGEGKTEEEIYKIIWKQIKMVNHKLTNYKCVKKLEIKTDAFEKTTTMKIKRFAEIQKDKEKEKETETGAAE